MDDDIFAPSLYTLWCVSDSKRYIFSSIICKYRDPDRDIHVYNENIGLLFSKIDKDSKNVIISPGYIRKAIWNKDSMLSYLLWSIVSIILDGIFSSIHESIDINIYSLLL